MKIISHILIALLGFAPVLWSQLGNPPISDPDIWIADPDGRVMIDHDGDGMPSSWELIYGLPHLDGSDGAHQLGSSGDLDNDGLSNLLEYQLGLNPRSEDTDGDGLMDWFEVKYGTDASGGSIHGIHGYFGDLDGDGILNFQDADPGDSAIGKPVLTISFPTNGSSI